MRNLSRYLLVRPMMGLIWIYRMVISPWIGSRCRYEITCSTYFSQALEKHGFLAGFYLGIMRILSCHPYSKRHHHDPVPKEFAWRDILRYNRRSKPFKKD